MISLTTFRANLFHVFRLSKSITVGFEVVHHNIVYDVTIVPSTKKPDLRRKPRKKKRGVQPEYIALASCYLCNELEVAGVCLNKRCSNSRLADK